MLSGNGTLWLVWGLLSLMLGGWLLAGLLDEAPAEEGLAAQARRFLLPGETSHGHYQIELACETCHRDPFGGDEALEDACHDCHDAELDVADDSHPKSKFTDPRNAERVARLDARRCITCHVEHRPQMTGVMGLTQPGDVCFHCHQGIAEERPSHAGMGFETCASAGCHNFHDNRALYEDFLIRHLDQPDLLAQPRLPERDLLKVLARSPVYPADRWPLRPLAAADVGEQDASYLNAEILADWAGTRHAAAGVDCSACHRQVSWVDRPGHRVCGVCHDTETEGFLSGRHGMRLAQGLSPMTPARARLPMKAEAGNREHGCNACHQAHRFDVVEAAAQACLGCHDDAHSRAYEGSPHHRLWQREQMGEAPTGSGVSCATCHLPRVAHSSHGVEVARVQHSPNDTLRPNEKMVRPVCLHCHGLEFTLDALADPQLIENNFRGRPARHVPSLDMAAAREAEELSSPQAKGENP